MEWLEPLLGLIERYGLAVVLVIIFIRKFNTIMNNTNKERKEVQNKIFDLATNHIQHDLEAHQKTINSLDNSTAALRELSEDMNRGRERAINEHVKMITLLEDIKNGKDT